MTATVHATAIVAPDAVLGEGVDVGAYAVIGPGVEIGPRTRIGAHAMVHRHTRLGADNLVHSFASVGDAPQDKKYKGEPTRLEIGDRNVFREFVTLNRGTATTGRHAIGDDNLFMAYSHVAHDCVVGSHVRARQRRDARRPRVPRRPRDHGRLSARSTSSARWARTRSSRTTPPSRATCRPT
jgi:UDP-N-acetylglucosamine acyltransferase